MSEPVNPDRRTLNLILHISEAALNVSALYFELFRTVFWTRISLSHENWHDLKNGLNRLRCVARNKCRQLIAGSGFRPSGLLQLQPRAVHRIPLAISTSGLSVMSISLTQSPFSIEAHGVSSSQGDRRGIQVRCRMSPLNETAERSLPLDQRQTRNP